MERKLLLIGASIGQVPLLKRAKEKGIHVTVATIPGNYPCIPMADDVIYRNIYDREGVAEEARKRGITAVTSDQNDLMNPTVAYVAENLGLPGNKFATVMAYCNKNLFRDMCEDAGVPVPKHVAVDSPDYDFRAFNCPLPWIVKPADSQSSIGVQRINNMKELKPALEFALSKSPTHNAIVEEFFGGHEVVCEGFIHEGRYYLLAFADRKYFDLPELMIPSQTLFPSTVDAGILQRIVNYETSLAEFSSPSFAIVHSEYLINLESGEIRAVESALRGGGVYISSDLIPMATGIDINEVLLKKAMGEFVDVESVFHTRKDKAAAYVCFYLPNGEIQAIEGRDELKNLPFVRKAYVDDLSVGQHTEPMTYKGARKGPILIRGENREDLEKNIRKAQNVFRIRVREDNGDIGGIVWQ